MSRHEEEIEGGSPIRDWTDDYQSLTNDAQKRQVEREIKLGTLRWELERCQRRMVYIRQEIALVSRLGEPQLALDDQPTFAPEWPNQRKATP